MTDKPKPLPEKYRLARNIATGMEVLDTGANEWFRVTHTMNILAPMKVTVLNLADGGEWSGRPDDRIMSRRVVDPEGTDQP